MKFVTAATMAFVTAMRGRTLRPVLRLLAIIIGSIALFSVAFHEIMAFEGRSYSWLTSVYWTIVTMSTLGFGDIVFTSDLGRVFSIVVLFAGATLILVLLPFTFIQLVYVPWQAASRAAQAPRRVRDDVRGHVLVTDGHPVARAVIDRARTAGMPAFVIVESVEEALRHADEDVDVVVGDLDDPATWRAAGVNRAALVFATRSDAKNANIVFTVRAASERCLIVATADSPDAIDVLELAGANHVVHLGELLGRALARRVLAPTARCRQISNFEDLVIAEASVAGTALVGRTLRELDLRAKYGVSVVGIWERGTLAPAQPDVRIAEQDVLLLAGRGAQLRAYDDAFAPERGDEPGPWEHPVIIIGGGRVGRAAAAALGEVGIASRIVERDATRPRANVDTIIGDAADLDVLTTAGIADTPAVVVTTHDDDMNVFLTLYARKLRPDIEVLARATHDRHLDTLHRAGADFVLSYASVGAIDVWNTLRPDSTLLLAEGLVVFRAAIPHALAGRPLRDTAITEETGCTVIALRTNGAFVTRLDPDAPLPRGGEMMLIGDDDAEARFVANFVAPDASVRTRRRRR